jgi:uncharacterized protein
LGFDGLGLDDLLNSVNAKHGSGTLDEAIQKQFGVAIAKCKEVPNTLSEAIKNNNPTVETAYNEVQKTIVLIKTDMPSALSVLITYQDNDGD